MGKVIRKEQCPSCMDSGRDNLARYADGGAYCFGCGYSERADEEGAVQVHVEKDLIPQTEPMLTQGKFCNIENRGLNSETCKRWGYHINTYTGYLGGKEETNTPVAVADYRDEKGQLIAQKLRTKDKRFKYLGKTTSLPLFGSWLCMKETKHFIVVVEGLEKAMAVSQVFDHKVNVVSLNNGAGNGREFKEHYNFLNKFKSIVVLMDMDEAGEAAAQAAVSLFPPGKVRIASISEKDPDDMLVKGKGQELKQAIWSAEIQRPEGVIDLSTLDETIFDVGFKKGYSTGFELLDKFTGGIRKGELTMITAGTGIGKTTFCTDLVYKWITEQNLKIADIKLEKNAKATLFDYCALHYGANPREFREDPSLITIEQRKEFLKFFSKKLYLYKHFGSMDEGPLLDLLEYYALIEEVDFIFFDHISIAVSGLSSSREGERKDIDRLTTKLRELIDRTGVGIVCVSHLRNPPPGSRQWEEGRHVRRSDLRGSGSLSQLSDNIISIEGNIIDADTKDTRLIKLIKCREGDAQEEYCDEFTFDVNTFRIKKVNNVI